MTIANLGDVIFYIINFVDDKAAVFFAKVYIFINDHFLTSALIVLIASVCTLTLILSFLFSYKKSFFIAFILSTFLNIYTIIEISKYTFNNSIILYWEDATKYKKENPEVFKNYNL